MLVAVVGVVPVVVVVVPEVVPLVVDVVDVIMSVVSSVASTGHTWPGCSVGAIRPLVVCPRPRKCPNSCRSTVNRSI